MIPEPTAKNLARDAEIDYHRMVADAYWPWIRRAVAAERERDELKRQIESDWMDRTANTVLREQYEFVLGKIASIERERDEWHKLIMDVERIVKADGTAESPLRSNLTNLVRDVVRERDNLAEELKRRDTIYDSGTVVISNNDYLALVRERDELRAEVERMKSEIILWQRSAWMEWGR